MQRHHKGHDYLFACLFPDEFAGRYVQFHPEDIVWLCKTCHKQVHLLYRPIITRFWADVKLSELSIGICMTYRELCTLKFEEWILK